MPEPRKFRYRWNAESGRYQQITTGQYVSQAKVTGALNRVVRLSRGNMHDLSEQLQNGEISLDDWRNEMAREIKRAHLVSAAAGQGGWAQMDAASYGRVGGKLQYQYEKLNHLSSEIQYGTQKLDGKFLQRANMYGNASRGTYQETVREQRVDAGMTEYRNLLHPADHCEGCLEESARGWVTIGDLVPIGQRNCLANDRCTYQYR